MPRADSPPYNMRDEIDVNSTIWTKTALGSDSRPTVRPNSSLRAWTRADCHPLASYWPKKMINGLNACASRTLAFIQKRTASELCPGQTSPLFRMYYAIGRCWDPGAAQHKATKRPIWEFTSSANDSRSKPNRISSMSGANLSLYKTKERSTNTNATLWNRELGVIICSEIHDLFLL